MVRWICISSALLFPGDGGYSIAATTLCTTTLPLLLSSASMCTGHSGWNAASVPLDLFGLPSRDATHPSLLLYFLMPWWALNCVCPSSLCPSLHPASPACSNMLAFTWHNEQISQNCLYVEQGTFCLIIVVQLDMTLKEGTKRFPHTDIMLASLLKLAF